MARLTVGEAWRVLEGGRGARGGEVSAGLVAAVMGVVGLMQGHGRAVVCQEQEVFPRGGVSTAARLCGK